MTDQELIKALLQENAQLRRIAGVEFKQRMDFTPKWYLEQKAQGMIDAEIALLLGIHPSKLSILKNRHGLVRRRNREPAGITN